MEITKKITLRAVEPYDIEQIIEWENNTSLWQYSNTISPFSRHTIEEFVLNSSNDIYADKQLRMMIDSESQTVGCVDLFDFDPYHRRIAIGILIQQQHRTKGYATQAIEQTIDFAFRKLELKQIYCDISKSNTETIKIFSKLGFKITGEKLSWRRNNGKWEDYYFLQLINVGI